MPSNSSFLLLRSARNFNLEAALAWPGFLFFCFVVEKLHDISSVNRKMYSKLQELD